MIRTKSNQVKREAIQVKYQRSGKAAIKITFPFNHEDLNNVKSLPGRKFHGSEFPKYWSCPLSIESVEKLQEWGFEMDQALLDFVNQSKVHVDDMETIEIPGLQKPLYDFQKKGVAFIEAKNGRALVGDSMGLGKTAQALAWLQLHPEKRPAIVVVPASLKFNWEREAHMWMDNPKVQVLSGKSIVPIIGEIVIINYDILPAWLGQLQKLKAQILVVDEIHFTKNSKAQRTKAIKALGKRIPHIIGLSGTPIVNRPIEFFNILKLIDDSVVPSFWDYANRYCNAKHNGFGWDFTGSKNTEELHERLVNSCMIRRKKEDVLTELPDKIHTAITMELTNRKEYSHAERDFISWVKKTKGNEAAGKAMNAEALAQIEGLKQLTIKGKMKEAVKWIKDFIEIDGKLIVFATHKSTIQTLMDEFKDIAVKIDGSVSQKDRQVAVDRFQTDDKIRLFVGNIKAAGVGITLTAASSVAFLELPVSPGDLTQAEDRAHRIGQKNAVNIYYLLAKGSIEEEIAEMLDRKKKVLDSVLDGKETKKESLLSELINQYS
jgi:SWI/SNF-related matrix-associated actin-dependent regulator 1 of chromatin subfamily A